MAEAFLILVFAMMFGWGLVRVLMGYATGWLPLSVSTLVLVLLLVV